MLALTSCAASASSFVGGFEDTKGTASDYDYNDLVFTLSSNTLMLSAQAQWFSEPILDPSPIGDIAGLGGTPFWNNSSKDGAEMNVGWCVWGGGNCNNGVAIDPGASYVATSNTSDTGAADNVSFSSSDAVTLDVSLHYAGFHNVIGWYALNNPSSIFWLDISGPATGTFTFDPDGAFGLVANTHDGSGGNTYYSDTSVGGVQDELSHFAFFGDPASSLVLFSSGSTGPIAPEPSTWLLLGSASLACILLRRRLMVR